MLLLLVVRVSLHGIVVICKTRVCLGEFNILKLIPIDVEGRAYNGDMQKKKTKKATVNTVKKQQKN